MKKFIILLFTALQLNCLGMLRPFLRKFPPSIYLTKTKQRTICSKYDKTKQEIKFLKELKAMNTIDITTGLCLVPVSTYFGVTGAYVLNWYFEQKFGVHINEDICSATGAGIGLMPCAKWIQIHYKERKDLSRSIAKKQQLFSEQID